MFICSRCKKNTEPGEKVTKKVTITRPQTYLNSGRTTHGTEIVEEINLCPRCAKEVE